MTDTLTPDQIEQQRAEERRLARKAKKKKLAAARNSFVESAVGSVDRNALREAMALYLEQQGIEPDDGAIGNTDGSPVVARANAAPMAFPANNINRWTPIGPSVVRQGQADGSPRVSGRIRDLAVSPDGSRAYAATAKGGVWFTSDGGAMWEPLGGWANEPRRRGGNTSAFSSGCLLVDFGANAAADFVMVGTGEMGSFQQSSGGNTHGMGVLVATGPASQALQADPWEAATGINVLEGHSIVRMVRVPGSTAGQNGDRVIAITSQLIVNGTGNIVSSGGIFMGTRSMVGGSLAFTWAALAMPAAALPANAGASANRDPTDLVYVGNRLFLCVRHTGVAISDNNGTSFPNWVTMNLTGGLPATARLVGRMSIALNDDNNRVYVLGEVDTTPGVAGNVPTPHVWQIANPTAAPGAIVANALANVPANNQLWPGQRDYDQAIEVTTRTTAAGPPPVRTDCVYIGGSLVGPLGWAGGTVPGLQNWNASIWAFDVAGANLVPSPGVSDVPAGTTHAANQAGLVGNHVHPDVHVLRKATNTANPTNSTRPVTRQIWVGCDGGVFVSLRDGQTNTFVSRNTGLASIESNFVASHPSSSHFAMLGCQDNGRQVRVGDSVWELKTNMQGDGGGVIFHPVQSHYVMGQNHNEQWACDPRTRYRAPVNGAAGGEDASLFYSGISAITQAVGNRARIALGTNRVWVTDNLGTSNPNTWRVLPFPAAANTAATNPRPGGALNPANAAVGRPPGLGLVVTVKWANPTTLLALYQLGVVRYQESAAGSGQWTATQVFRVVTPTPAVPAPFVVPIATFFTDIEPVPGGNDFYLLGTGQTSFWAPGSPPVPAADSCFYFDSNAPAATGGFRPTGLGQTLPAPVGLPNSPVDPAYSVVIDPANPNTVYVGTSTGVWQGTRNPAAANPWAWNWVLFANGLPESTVQDLTVWTDPAGAAGSPRLLRAALQARGVWEVNLAAQEPSRTYLRVHERDDRRMLPTPMKNPRRRPNAPDVPVFRSPDIVIRPQTPVANTPSFRGTNLTNSALPYQLWTFQSAFRWLYPSVIPNGEWSDQFGDLVERHRRVLAIPAAGSRRVDAALWNSVMAAALDENGQPGVFRAAWQNAVVPNLPGSEIDLMETVVPRRDTHGIWQVYRERSIVDILLHHRDTRPVAANGAFAVLLWRDSSSGNSLMNTDCTNIVPYVRSLVGGGAAQPVPAGWNVALSGGSPLHRLAVPLAARMPRAVSASIDLSGLPNGRRVLLLAIAGSTADQFTAVPTGPIDRVERFVRRWPHAAARLISVWRRPGTQLFP